MSLGVIGGLGPMATACFMEKVIAMTAANTDQEHVEMIIYNCPTIPDRTGFIIGKSDEDPYPHLLRLAKKLEEQGVSAIAIPCITARFFKDKLQQEISVPVIHGLDATALYFANCGISKVGIAATEGSIQSGVIKKALNTHGVEAIVPDQEYQDMVTSLIYDDVKQGKKPDLSKLEAVKSHLNSKGAQIVLLGCTELSVINHDCLIGEGFFDILDMLASESIRLCGAPIREEYKYLRR